MSTDKQRWTPEQRRAARGGVERRAGYAGSATEVREFRVGLTNTAPISRSAAVGNSTSDITVRGSAVMYEASYEVEDGLGPPFRETIAPGALTSALATSDVLFRYDHVGPVLARTSAATLALYDSVQSLDCVAVLDPRHSASSDLAVSIGRGDCSAMSWAFRVAPGGDQWSDDFMQRRITRVSDVFDVAAVGRPASPTTSICVIEAPPHLQPDLRAQAEAVYAFVASEIRKALAVAQAELRHDAAQKGLCDELAEMRREDALLRRKYGVPATKTRSRRPA